MSGELPSNVVNCSRVMNMLKKFVADFNDATSLEKFNSLASLISLSGISMLTIINAIGGVNIMQLAISFLVLAFIFCSSAFLIFVYLFLREKYKTFVNSYLIALISVGMILFYLFYLLYCINEGIVFIKSFKDY